MRDDLSPAGDSSPSAEHLLNGLMDSSNSLVAVLDQKLRVITLNPRYRDVFQTTFGATVEFGRPLLEPLARLPQQQGMIADALQRR